MPGSGVDNAEVSDEVVDSWILATFGRPVFLQDDLRKQIKEAMKLANDTGMSAVTRVYPAKAAILLALKAQR